MRVAAPSDPGRLVGLAVAAAAAVLLIAGGAFALRDSSGTPAAKSAAPSTGAPATASQASTSSPPRPPPPGTQQVTFRSLAVTVPASLARSTTQYCGSPRSDTVLLPEAPTAGLSRAGGRRCITWVQMFGVAIPRNTRATTRSSTPHTRPIAVDGQSATDDHRRDPAAVMPSSSSDVPAARARATVYSPSPGTRPPRSRCTLDRGRRGQPRLCHPTRRIAPLPADPPPAQSGGCAQFAHSRRIPSSMVICGYVGERAVQWKRRPRRDRRSPRIWRRCGALPARLLDRSAVGYSDPTLVHDVPQIQRALDPALPTGSRSSFAIRRLPSSYCTHASACAAT